MKKLIVSGIVDTDHQDRVAEAVDKLQAEGFEVTDINRTEKIRFGSFGKDVTEISYEPNKHPR